MVEKKNIPTKKNEYVAATGKRKEAVAQVRLWNKKEVKEIEVNEKKLQDYFPNFEFQEIIKEPLKRAEKENKFMITIRVKGGGKRGQAEAAQLGIARALIKIEEGLRRDFKKAGLLTRDSRMKERKKPGLKGARRAPQWSKR
ncbi:30S ribosomal protein S9 [Patescibacteria group bacterium]